MVSDEQSKLAPRRPATRRGPPSRRFIRSQKRRVACYYEILLLGGFGEVEIDAECARRLEADACEEERRRDRDGGGEQGE